MKLLLTSSGNTNKTIEAALLELLGKQFSASNLVFIPTAANVEEDISGWLSQDIENFKKLEFSSFQIIDISKVLPEVFLPILEKTDIIVFGGGNVKYLLEWVRKTKLETFLNEFVTNHVYVGISAGSMITARNISLSDANELYYEKTDGLENIEGLGYVNFEIRPHLNSDAFPGVRVDVLGAMANKTKTPIYALDDASAIKVEGDKIEVVSEGEWKKFN